MNFATNMSGGLCSPDNDDYFRVVLPAGNKSIRLITNANMTTTGSTGGIYLYLYNKYQQQLTNKYLALSSTSITDTLDFTCFEGDTFYVRVQHWTGNCKQYSIRTLNTNHFTLLNDTETNDNFTSAQGLIFQKDTTGHLASQRYLAAASDDQDDYYRCALPAGGTKSLRLITQTRLVTPGATGGVYYYLYNKYQQQLSNMYVAATTTSRTDTLDFTCFEGDTFYVRIQNWTGPCKEYRIRADYTNEYTLQNDSEPNDNFNTALALPFQTNTTGHLASQRYLAAASSDQDDYYRCVLPPGTKSLRLISSTRMVQAGATGGVYYYLYNKYQQQLTNKYIALTSSFKTDTLDFNCFEGDTFYVRVLQWTGPCKEYQLRMEHTNNFSLINDTETNDNFATAQGLTFQKDTTGHLASERYLGGASDDLDDYYRCVLPPGGTKSLRLITSTRIVQPGATGGVYYYLYNKYQQQLTNMYVGATNTVRTDTLDFTCFEGDTFYVRVYQWTGPCKEYRIRTDYTNQFNLQNDSEPNDDFSSALLLPFAKDTSGHLAAQRYLGGASTDQEDYYKVVMPVGSSGIRLITATRMVQPGATGGIYYYLYNKFQQQLTNRYVSINNNLKVDTIDVTCFSGDTFYVRVYQWTGPCKEYRIRLETTNQFTLANDKEPNESTATATPIAFERDTTGLLGTQVYGTTTARTDNDDYYRCIQPQNGLGLRLIIKSRLVNSGGSGGMYAYVYNRSGAQVGNRFLTLTSTLRTDTLDFPCYTGDTFYVRFNDYSGPCKEYSFRVQNTRTGPVKPDFETARFGNNFSFINRSRHATRYHWTFGSQGTDTVAYPTRQFSIGTYVVRLSATNVCGTAIFTDTIMVDGIEYFTPKNAGSENNLGAFHIRAFGAGLDTNLSMILRKGGQEFRPFRKKSPGQAEFTGWFNFKDVPPGTYDVEIRLSNNQVFNYPSGFTVYVDSPGFNIYTEIFAPNRVRTGRMNWYALRVHNKKGRDANGVRAFIVTSRGMQTTIKDILYKPKGKLLIKGSEYDKLTIDMDAYKQLYYGGDFDPNRDTLEVDYDKIYSAFDTLLSFNIDSLHGEPFRGTVYPIYIPFIKANGSHTLYFQASTPGNGDFRLVSYVTPWTVRQNPLSAQTLDYIHEGGLQAAALAEYAPNPALKAVGKSAAYIDIASQSAFAEYFDWYYGTNVADDAFYAKQGMNLAGEVAGELVPFGNKADAAVDQARHANKQIGRYTEHLNFDQDLILSGIKDPNLAKHMSDRLEFLKNGIDQYGKQLTQAEKEAALNATLDWATKQGINLTEKQLEKLMFPEDKQLKKVESLNSFDPNAIYGPDGPGTVHYIRRSRPLNYEVTFENVDTALAPAQIVRVAVALDTNKFDLRETWLNGIRLSGKLYTFEEDRKEYFRDIDLRPARNMLVRVNAKTDTLKGTLYWEFITLDPITKNLIADVDSGFLPPNKNAPEGEGAVSFSTRLKPTVANKDSISAFATIWFDENAPILTNTWINRVDEGRPSSVLNPSVQVTADTIMTLNLSGTDAESGFQEYRLYVKKGDSAWATSAIPLNAVTGTTLIGAIGETYSFYVEARDSVGIWESKQAKAEATVKLNMTSGPLPNNATAVFPNPAQNSVTVRVNVAQDAKLRINITNISGQLVAAYDHQHPAGTSNYVLPTVALQAGVYFVEVLINNETLDTKKLIIHR